jgi:N-acetylglucosamine-6-phosphate deacetylase
VRRLLAAQLALGGAIAPGWVALDGAQVAAVAHGAPPGEPDERLDGILAPGLCDLQVNGAGGREVEAGQEALDAIDALQLAHGVTSWLPTLVSPGGETAERALEQIATRAGDARSGIAGAHLEGPFLSPAHRGVHPLERLRVPADGVPGWFEHPAVRLVTIAPELPGALELIARLHGRGVAVAVGHSAAGADVARAAFDAGATLLTHAFNAMAPLHHRAPGLIGAALVDERVRVAVIADGEHVDPVVLEIVRRAGGARVVLVSDASPAAAAPPGRYAMGGIALASDGVRVTLADGGRLAGSALTLDAAARNWAAFTHATRGQALLAASEAPAAAAGLPSAARAGGPADLVLLDEAGGARRVMKAGGWLPSGQSALG